MAGIQGPKKYYFSTKEKRVQIYKKKSLTLKFKFSCRLDLNSIFYIDHFFDIATGIKH